jgi:glycosyltransferase involved in cell wall biosynthesis
MTPPEIALVLTTFEQPRHLRLALQSIACQQTSRPFEVIVADDGSQDETAAVVAEYSRRVPFSVRFVTQPHAGFRAARCRNAGVRAATASHLLFCDGDCVLPPDHLETHLRAWRSGHYTSGFCIRLDEAASQRVTAEVVRRGDLAPLASPAESRKLAKLHRKAFWYNLLGHATKPALKSTDFSLARADFELVNGFDERFQGWGCEDDDLGRRLIAAGLRPISILDQTRLYHLWHPPASSKPAEWKQGNNVAYLERPIRLTRCLQGLVTRKPRELTVRLAGQCRDGAALAQLLRLQGWKIECHSARRADIELLALPGTGHFRGRGECRVAAVLDDSMRLAWCARRAQIVLSPSGTIGRSNQLRLRLADAAAFWQSLLVGQINATPPSHVPSAATRPSFGFASRPATKTA